jgi:uncharacterized membrane protein YgdD (TMEM256/DUF423 family)
MTSSTALRLSAALGFLAVALGAFGAHGLKELLTQNATLATYETAAHYHLLHAVAMLWVSTREPLPVWSWRCFCAGIVIFSGSLYVLAITGVKVLGAITPIGGVLLLVGWLLLVLRPEGRSAGK